MDLLAPRIPVLTVVIASLMFAVVVFSRWRSRGALAAAVPVVPLVIFYDSIGARRGWWHYPSVEGGATPIAWYIAGALWYGAAHGLVAWRVIRRFGTAGLVAFLAGLALFGVTHDYLYSVMAGLTRFGPGLVPLIADLVAYASGGALVQLLMYWIVGSPRGDRLGRPESPEANLQFQITGLGNPGDH